MKRISLKNLIGLSLKESGLQELEVLKQRERFGLNSIQEFSSPFWIVIFKDTLRDPMIWFLLGISFVFFFVGQVSEAWTLLVAILPLGLMDIYLHWHTGRSTKSLKNNLNSTVNVIRDSELKAMDSKELVPGDLVKLSSGDFIPADGIITDTDNLQVDESVLTGEALALRKVKCSLDLNTHQTSKEVLLASENLAFAGTKVLTGQALLRVLETADRTEYGEIVKSVTQAPFEKTPLQKSIGIIVKNLIFSAIGFCILLAIVRVYQGQGLLDALLSAATLAVAAIPEEFPVVFSFFLGIGVYR